MKYFQKQREGKKSEVECVGDGVMVQERNLLIWALVWSSYCVCHTVVYWFLPWCTWTGPCLRPEGCNEAGSRWFWGNRGRKQQKHCPCFLRSETESQIFSPCGKSLHILSTCRKNTGWFQDAESEVTYSIRCNCPAEVQAPAGRWSNWCEKNV